MAAPVPPYWQICMTCNRREYSSDAVTCRCGAKMIDCLDHPDNASRKHPPKAHAAPKAEKPAA